MKIWLDDERTKPDDSWYWAKDSKSAIIAIALCADGQLDEVSLDHDLGYSYLDSNSKIDGGMTAGQEDTGMKVLAWMINTETWPKVLTIHTANPSARAAMLLAANNEAPDWVDIYVMYW